MKIFFVYSSSYQEALRVNNTPLMFSWINSKVDKQVEIVIPDGYSEVMIDSGGYQLQTGCETKKSITVGHYALWLQQMLPAHPEVVAYMNLDIMGDLDTTLRNQSYLESEGLKPLPIWHVGDSEKLLKYYADKYEWIALGGFVSSSMGKPGIRRTFNWIKQNFSDTKFHFLGIGFTGASSFRTFRPYSTDCSTWTAPVRFGVEVVLTKEGLLKESTGDEEYRNKIRNDKEFQRKALIETVRRIKQYGDDLEKLNDDFQANLF